MSIFKKTAIICALVIAAVEGYGVEDTSSQITSGLGKEMKVWTNFINGDLRTQFLVGCGGVCLLGAFGMLALRGFGKQIKVEWIVILFVVTFVCGMLVTA